MHNTMDKEKFILKANIVHNNKYDYNKVEYKDSKTKICITCPIHGDFWQIPNTHLLGHGCPKCGHESANAKHRLDIATFIEKANQIHHNKYDYSKVEYVDGKTKVCITCPIHGDFWQTPHSHLRGYKCKKCASVEVSTQNNLTLNKFIEKANKIHDNKYDYSKSVYVNYNTPLTIICPIHGEFQQTPTRHLNSSGCIKCAMEEKHKRGKNNKQSFISKATAKYGNIDDYSSIDYINSRTKINIICKKHGVFSQAPAFYLQCRCCPKCMEEKKAIRKKVNKKIIISKEERLKNKIDKFVEQSLRSHEIKYDYSKVYEYGIKEQKVCIICPKHGEFWQNFKNHERGCDCPKCASQKVSNKLSDTKETFIAKAKSIHGGKYDYSKVDYVNNHTKVCIICPKHGEFWQTPSMHYSEGQGCPMCGTLSSKDENEIYEVLKEALPNEEIIQRDHTLIKPKELDIFIPSLKIGIEYNGVKWHSEEYGKHKNYHLTKLEKCNEKGVKLITIFSDEFLQHKDIVKAKILHIIGKSAAPSIYGRKTSIKLISKKDGSSFLNEYHIQGACNGSKYYGCFNENKLVAVMAFKRRLNNDNSWELSRYATDYHYRCVGTAAKMFTKFIKDINPTNVISFADRRWTLSQDDNLYVNLGFALEKVLEPDYRYYCKKYYGENRIHKFNFRKQTLHKKFGFSLEMTEAQMCKELKAYRVWDCGLYKYVWKNKNILS